jgi:hypothetical protein
MAAANDKESLIPKWSGALISVPFHTLCFMFAFSALKICKRSAAACLGAWRAMSNTSKKQTNECVKNGMDPHIPPEQVYFFDTSALD